VALEGTDTWRTAYWEITDIKFAGVNQGPQAAARFWLGDKIYFTRVRYAVIRPCGPLAGVNLLQDCKPITEVSLGIRAVGGNVELFWPANAEGWTLQETPDLSAPQWGAVTVAPVVRGNENVVTLPIAGVKFFRLIK
jgi:hypothetical protein